MTSQDHIYRTLRNRVIFLEYPPGRILNEKVLAEEFGVSRTPLREVLNRLEWEKLVRIIPRTGTMVTEIELPKVRNAFQVRFEIEKLAAFMAAQRITDEQIEQIDVVKDECANLMSEKEPKRLVDIDFKFRDIIYAAAGNDILRDISDHLYHLTVRVWYMVFNRVQWESEVQSFLEEIAATAAVLRRRNPPEAAQLRHDYLVKFVERIKDLF
ncbi:MAG: GntR family transcriptional regulator [Thermodesulfobacteriota bacterium]